MRSESISKINSMEQLLKVLIFCVGLILVQNAKTQPSGGPYGPIPQTYELPVVSGTIYYISPDGKTDADGKSLKTPTTLENAISKVITGDAIVLRGGTYRTGDLMLNQSIVMQPYQDEIPVVKGTLIAKDWEGGRPPFPGAKGLWKIKWKHLFPSAPDDWWRKESSGRITPLHKFNNDMVFINGKFLQSAGWLGELDENHYYIDYENQYVYISSDPTDKQVEITAFNRGLVITPMEVNGKKADHKGPAIKGITFTQYAFHVIDVEGYYPEGISKEEEHGKDVVGTTFENCTISYSGRVGAFMLGDKLTFKNCKVTHTGTEGIYIVASSDVLLERNIFTQNNIEDIHGYYASAVKIFNQTHRVTCNDNLVIDLHNSVGIWYDVGNEDGVFTNNWIQNVGDRYRTFVPNSAWPADNGFFFEISKRAIVAGNVFINDDNGIAILNSSGAKVYNNTFVNSTAVFNRTRRGENTDHFGWHITTGPDVLGRINHEFVNNLMVGDADYNRPLLSIGQMPDQCDQQTIPALKTLDHNAYVKLGNNEEPIIWLSQKLGEDCETTFSSTSELNNKVKNYEKGGISLLNYSGPLFKSIELNNFQLQDGFKGENAAMTIPKEILEVIKNQSSTKYIGAYPPQ